MRLVVVAIIAIWAAWVIYWLGSAVGANATRREFNPRGAPLRVAVGLTTGLIFTVLARAGVDLNSLSVHVVAIIALGFVLLVGGLAVAIWARVHLGRNWGMPTTQRVEAELITSGPYTYVRHPIYSGLLLAGIGTSVAINVIGLVIVAMMTVYFVYSARVEEANLTKVFPDAYPAYRSRSKMIIPFVL